MRRSVGIALAWALLAAAPASGQSVVETLWSDVTDMFTDLGAVWLSPFRGSASDYATAGLVGGATGLLLLVDEPVADWVRDHQHTAMVDAFQPFGEDSDPPIEKLTQAPLLDQVPLAVYVVGLVVGSRSLRDGATGCLTGHQAQALPRHYFYKVFGRERPLVVDDVARRQSDESAARPGDAFDFHVPGQPTWYDNSFPGGHTLNVTTCISYLNHRFDLGLAEPALWGFAAGVSLARIADQRHWTSDTFLGSVIGIAIGKYLAGRSLDRLREDRGEAVEGDAGARPELVMAPARGGGAMVGWRIRF